jgi:GntR family transcriptional regulator, transcriptional repressor for pyruvate dehydrogenase complex
VSADPSLGGAFSPLRRERLSDAVADRLRAQIREGGLKPDERLPGHRELAEAFSVGLSSIREAISMLASEGLVETRAGRGTFVREGRRPPLTLAAGGPLSQREVEEAIEAREVLELQLAAMAAEHASPEDVARLRTCLAAMETAVDDASAYAQADLDLHLAIAAASRNRFLQQAMEQIRTIMRSNMEVSFFVAMERRGSLQVSLDSHRELVEQIEAGDADGARQTVFTIMSRHHGFVLGGDTEA